MTFLMPFSNSSSFFFSSQAFKDLDALMEKVFDSKQGILKQHFTTF